MGIRIGRNNRVNYRVFFFSLSLEPPVRFVHRIRFTVLIKITEKGKGERWRMTSDGNE